MRVVGLGGLTAIGLVSRHVASTLWKQEFSARQQLEQALEELRRTHLQLVQSEKAAAFGQLVAGLAHELNNPLAIIASTVQPIERAAQALIENARSEDRDVGKARQTISVSTELLRRGVERAAAVTKSVRQYVVASRGQIAAADLGRLLETSVAAVAMKAVEKMVTVHRALGESA